MRGVQLAGQVVGPQADDERQGAWHSSRTQGRETDPPGRGGAGRVGQSQPLHHQSTAGSMPFSACCADGGDVWVEHARVGSKPLQLTGRLEREAEGGGVYDPKAVAHFRLIDRRTDIQTGGQVDRQAGRQGDRWTGRQADRGTGGQAGRQTGGRADRQAGRQAGHCNPRQSTHPPPQGAPGRGLSGANCPTCSPHPSKGTRMERPYARTTHQLIRYPQDNPHPAPSHRQKDGPKPGPIERKEGMAPV